MIEWFLELATGFLGMVVTVLLAALLVTAVWGCDSDNDGLGSSQPYTAQELRELDGPPIVRGGKLAAELPPLPEMRCQSGGFMWPKCCFMFVPSAFDEGRWAPVGCSQP